MTPEVTQLVLEHVDLVWLVAHTDGRRLGTDFDDLVADGMVGLCVAATRFDDDLACSFKTFAWHRIRGAMQDGIRARCGREGSARRRAGRPANVEALEEAGALPGIEHAAEEAFDLADAVQSVIASLPANLALIANDWLADVPPKETAIKLGVTRSAVYWSRRTLLRPRFVHLIAA